MNKVYVGTYQMTCALGDNVATIYDKMEQNQCGISPHTILLDKNVTLPLGLLAERQNFEKLTTNYIEQVVNDSRLDFQDKKTLLIISTTKGSIEKIEDDANAASLHHLSTFFQEKFNTKNKPLIISNACISGIVAMTIAHDLIKTEKYDKVLVCGCDVVSRFVASGFTAFQALSDKPSQPYDKDRKGLNIGEACGVVLLQKEKTDIEVCGGASSNDANHISGPSRDGSGLALAIKKAMQQANVSELDAINAHGTATPYNDEMECHAFHSLDLQNVPLNTFKGYWGHTLGAAGIVESIMAIEMMKKNHLFKTMGYENKGISKPLNIITENQDKNINTIIKTGSGFGGCNAAIIFKKCNE